MKEFDVEFREEYAVFFTVGMLRELMKNYPDHTPLTVCGTPGSFRPDEDGYGILLETLDCCDPLELMAEAATSRQEHMDF